MTELQRRTEEERTKAEQALKTAEEKRKRAEAAPKLAEELRRNAKNQLRMREAELECLARTPEEERLLLLLMYRRCRICLAT